VWCSHSLPSIRTLERLVPCVLIGPLHSTLSFSARIDPMTAPLFVLRAWRRATRCVYFSDDHTAVDLVLDVGACPLVDKPPSHGLESPSRPL
jgi:hypothetical protein